MFDAEERAAIEAARVSRLATADAEGRPHVVPICFALVETPDGPNQLVTAVDEKPKTASPAALRRVRDIHENPRVAMVVDYYAESWDHLGWVQVRGTATVLDPGDAGHAAAVHALRERYDQYESHALEERPIIAISPATVRSWGDLSTLAG